MNQHDAILANPGLLKLHLMMRGLRLPEPVREGLQNDLFGATGHALFGSAGDLDLSLPQDIWVTVPVLHGEAMASPYELVRHGDGYAIAVDPPDGEPSERAKPTKVKVLGRSRFFDHTTSTGIPYGRIGTVHGPYLALSPTNQCSFLNNADRCRFCGVGSDGGTHAGVPVDDILEAIRIAREEHPVNMVYLSVGHLGTDDGGVTFLEPYVEAIKKHFDILVAVDALPPATNDWIDRTYAMGVDSVSYNLEIFDPDRFALLCPGPARVIGRQRFLEALSYATTVFPSGGVTCHLIVGLESLECTHAGVEALTEMGVLPVLPVYRPFKGRDLRGDADVMRFEPSLEELIEVYTHLYEAVRDKKLGLNLVRDLAIVTTPLDARFFGGETGWWSSLRHRMMSTRIARRTSARLSDLRRRLRVREAPAEQG